MKIQLSKLLFLPLSILSCSLFANNTQQINISPSEGDDTFAIHRALSKASSKKIRIVMERGEYEFSPNYAFEKYCTITNHNNGLKKIVFPFEDFESVEIVGNGSSILCDGQLFPFLFENCDQVKVSDLSIDWDTPFLFYGEVVNVDKQQGYRDIKPLSDPESWKIKNGKLLYPNSHDFNFNSLGATLPFDPVTKSVVKGAIDTSSTPERVELLDNGNIRIWEKLKYYPPVGSTLNSKGEKEASRYAPAFDFKECSNIVLDNVTIHHALGMGFLFERSSDIQILNSNIILPTGSDRVVTTIADATHFANCKGDILVENCIFENMLDDGTNVHGTYIEVTDIIDSHTINASLKHFQQAGFNFAQAGDDVWFIMQPSPKRVADNRVESVDNINETMMTIKFEKALPEGIKQGDFVENKSWNPTFTMRGCTVRNNRARGIVLKTPLKTVIENNIFSSMMSAILFRGETYSWFESGGVEDVLIRNNHIKNSATCGTTHAALYITPRLGKTYDSTEFYDRNIRFIDNTIDSYNPRVVIADRVDGLLIKGNTIIKNSDEVAPFPCDPIFEFINCSDIEVVENEYKGDKPYKVLEIDQQSKKELKASKNTNLNL